jgi:hypothetical protein
VSYNGALDMSLPPWLSPSPRRARGLDIWSSRAQHFTTSAGNEPDAVDTELERWRVVAQVVVGMEWLGPKAVLNHIGRAARRPVPIHLGGACMRRAIYLHWSSQKESLFLAEPEGTR